MSNPIVEELLSLEDDSPYFKVVSSYLTYRSIDSCSANEVLLLLLEFDDQLIELHIGAYYGTEDERNTSVKGYSSILNNMYSLLNNKHLNNSLSILGFGAFNNDRVSIMTKTDNYLKARGIGVNDEYERYKGDSKG